MALTCRMFFCLLLAGGSARAADNDPVLAKIEAREKQARAACDGGRLDEGVRLLAELFAETDDGNYIFNQGRCYQQNGRAQEAALRYEMYLKRPDKDPSASAFAQEYIAGRPPPAPPPVDVLPPAPADSGRTLRRAGLVVAGAGLAALGAATYFGLQIAPTKAKADEVAKVKPFGPEHEKELGRLNDKGDRVELLQWIFIGVGATAVTTGAVLTYLGLRSDDSPRMGLTPAVGPRFAGLSLAGSF